MSVYLDLWLVDAFNSFWKSIVELVVFFNFCWIFLHDRFLGIRFLTGLHGIYPLLTAEIQTYMHAITEIEPHITGGMDNMCD